MRHVGKERNRRRLGAICAVLLVKSGRLFAEELIIIIGALPICDPHVRKERRKVAVFDKSRRLLRRLWHREPILVA